MADKVIVLEGASSTTFGAREIVSIENLKGRGWGAKEEGCSDYTKIMLIEPADNGDWDENLKALKRELSEKLG